MEILKSQYKLLNQAIKRLKYMVEQFTIICNKNHCPTEENDYILHRDALITRFEFCYDLTWKFLKKYLEEKSGILVASPKKVFQACLEQKIATIDETKKLLEMVNIRNNTSHIYSEEMADQSAKLIPDYYQLMATIISRIKIE